MTIENIIKAEKNTSNEIIEKYKTQHNKVKDVVKNLIAQIANIQSLSPNEMSLNVKKVEAAIHKQTMSINPSMSS
ncbi:MAG: hypothetical protein ACD_21C00052G0017 [uncultured bacterium]|nr:MAG: hypothetical protein ACD_21C00052G0017 [uncultured bacterium]